MVLPLVMGSRPDQGCEYPLAFSEQLLPPDGARPVGLAC
ncbi:hypothetical protein MITS9504_02071 [Synechococcus sp. MIT S9504]|nr:hypothetical protein MITS9504_02071 [Synechococcus sp. MIT S9504]